MFRGVSALDRTPVAAPVLSAAGVFHCRRRRVETQELSRATSVSFPVGRYAPAPSLRDRTA